MHRGLFRVALLVVSATLSGLSFSQTTQVRFGQNRVQYHDFNWLYYDSDNFTTYFYPGGQEIGEFVVLSAERILEEMETQLDFRSSGRVNILVYNDITDLSQTNIGLGNENYNMGGTTRIYGNKMFLYFDGNHDHLLRDLRKGLGEIFIHAMLTGNVFQELINKTAFFTIPDWFEKGLAMYLGEPWNTSQDDRLRDFLLHNKKANFSTLEKLDPELAGHSMWYYLEHTYGRDAIRNILYLSRINRSVNSGLYYATGRNLEENILGWTNYYQTKYNRDISGRQTSISEQAISLRTRKNRTFGEISLSPDGKQLAYAIFNGGAFKIMVQDLDKKKARKVFKGGFRSDSYPFDHSYPIIAWTPSGSTMGAVFEKRDKVYLREWDVNSKKKTVTEIRNFQRVNDFSYSTDSRNIVMAVQIRGQSDIYTLNLANMNARAVTNDIWDDATPAYVRSGNFEGFVFASNRPTDTLGTGQRLDTIMPGGKYDLFFQHLNNPSNVLGRITRSGISDEYKPQFYDNESFIFLSEENGIFNQYSARLDSLYLGKDSIPLSYDELAKDDFGNPLPGEEQKKKLVDVYSITARITPLTDAPATIRDHSVASMTGKSALFFNWKEKPVVAIIAPDSVPLTGNLPRTSYWSEVSTRSVEKDTVALPGETEAVPEGIRTNNNTLALDSLLTGDFPYYFKSDFNNTVEPKVAEEAQTAEGGQEISAAQVRIRSDFRPSKIVPYKVRFSSDYVVTQLDNSILMQQYQSFDVNGGAFKYPDLSGMITFGVSDLMEDHKIVGGFRIPTNFEGSQVFVSYENLKKRFDYRLLFYRDSYQQDLTYNPTGTNIFIPVLGKIKSHYAEASVSYPFDVIRSVRLVGGFRNDRRFIALTDPVSAQLPNTNENWISGRLEYVHDNTKEIQLNIYNGLRYKVFGEYMRNLQESKSNLYNIGFDVRHYQKIYRNIIWANRLAGASSLGQRKIAYFLGGVDTWLNPDYNYDIPVDFNNGYAFQASATNLRGLPQNIRNGNSYILWNSELRFPVISAFVKRPLKSSFLHNFQLIGFFDIGSAYTGITPFDDKNPFNSEQIIYQAGGIPVTIINVDYFRRPTVFGYGGGVRSSLLGYFIRVDAAWGFDGTSVSEKPMWLISLSKDF